MRRRLLPLVFLVLMACARKGVESENDAKSTVDGDPLVLFPGSAIVVAMLDARAMVASASVGATLGSFVDALVPLGPDAGFQASRDVDRALVGVYAGTQADFAVVLSGRFDPDKIAAVNRTSTGTPIVKAAYAGFATESIGAITIAPITAKTVVVGSSERVHRILDRLGPTKLERAVAPWVAETLASPGAQFSIAADFATQPIVSATFGSINLNWLKGLQVVRGIGDFDAPGVNVAATLTYADATQAEGAVEGMRLIDGWQRALAPLLLGAKIQNFQASSTARDVSCKFAVDDSSLRTLLALASRYVHPSSP